MLVLLRAAYGPVFIYIFIVTGYGPGVVPLWAWSSTLTGWFFKGAKVFNWVIFGGPPFWGAFGNFIC